MSNQPKIKELLAQIEIWEHQIEITEDMIEEAYHRIDELGGINDETIQEIT